MIDELNFECKHTFKFFDYPVQVMTSKVRRTVYYTDKDKLPKKYANNIGLLYDWDDGVLYDLRTNKNVIKNIRTAGTPKFKRINGQNLHDLSLRDYDRSKIVHTIKNYFYEEMKGQIVNIDKNKPVIIHMMFVTDSNSIGDIDNHALFYQKSFFDSIQTTKIIKDKKTKEIIKVPNSVGFIDDDSVKYISDFVVSFREINKNYKRNNCLIVKIYQKRENFLPANIKYIVDKATEFAWQDCKNEGISDDSPYFKGQYDYYFEQLMKH